MADEFDGTFGFDQPIEQHDDFGINDVDGVDNYTGETPEYNNVDDIDGDNGLGAFGFDAAEETNENQDASDFGFTNDVEENNQDVFGIEENNGEMSSIFDAQPEIENTDAFTKWEKEHEKMLLARAEKQRQEKQRSVEDAKKQLTDFYAKREATISKNKASNKAEEKKLKADLAKTLESGSDWEKVAKYCDLKPKSEGKGGQIAKNERMRKLIVSLKNEGISN